MANQRAISMQMVAGMELEFEKISLGKGLSYWGWRDINFLPYAWLEEKDLKNLPVPLFVQDIHPDCKIGFESGAKDAVANIIELPAKFELLKMDPDLRKDLKRVEKKNSQTSTAFNEKGALDMGKHWFLEQWGEDKGDFERRLALWKEKAYTMSAYSGRELLGVHIAIEEKETAHYLGCWWNRKYRNLAVPTFLLKRDIERAIGKKLKYYDLGVGDEPYKKKWGVAEKPAKYYAVLTKELAEKLGVKRFIEMKAQSG